MCGHACMSLKSKAETFHLLILPKHTKHLALCQGPMGPRGPVGPPGLRGSTGPKVSYSVSDGLFSLQQSQR